MVEQLVKIGRRYLIYRTTSGLCIKCLKCTRVSYSPEDIENKFCGYCHKYLEEG